MTIREVNPWLLLAFDVFCILLVVYFDEVVAYCIERGKRLARSKKKNV